MAQDRFVFFRKETPSYEDIKCLLEDYVRGLATQVTFEAAPSKDKSMEFWGVLLPGTPTFPFRRVKGFEGLFGEGKMQPKERWFEVVVTRDKDKVTSLDVITRLADELTGVIADGFVAICVRCWKAKVDR